MKQIEQRREEFDLRLKEMSERVQEDSKAFAERVNRNDKFNKRITWLLVGLVVAKVISIFIQMAFPNGI